MPGEIGDISVFLTDIQNRSVGSNHSIRLGDTKKLEMILIYFPPKRSAGHNNKRNAVFF